MTKIDPFGESKTKSILENMALGLSITLAVAIVADVTVPVVAAYLVEELVAQGIVTQLGADALNTGDAGVLGG
jgi:hypothetical protein